MSEYTRNGSHGMTRAERDWVSRLVCVFTVTVFYTYSNR